jgi:hypothetical protein
MITKHICDINNIRISYTSEIITKKVVESTSKKENKTTGGTAIA